MNILCKILGHNWVDASKWYDFPKRITKPLNPQHPCGQPDYRLCHRCRKIHHKHNWKDLRTDETPIGRFSVNVKNWRKCSICSLEAYTGHGDYTRLPNEEMGILSEEFTKLGGTKTFGMDSGLFSNVFESIVTQMTDVKSVEQKQAVAKRNLLAYLGG